MEQLNFALITALYCNQTRGLYSDVYFPIIKYAICKVFSAKDGEVYSSADEIQSFIMERFRLEIPTIVIAMTVRKIGVRNRGNLQLVTFEKDSSFKICKAYMDNEEEIKVEEREKEITEKQQTIEEEYKAFISREGMYDDNVTFLQFISDNTDDILGYLKENNVEEIDEKYTSLIFFLQYLSEKRRDLYDVANLLFWSSIIAAFLKSEKPRVDDTDDGVKKEYFLDTSVVMGLLNLSTPQREKSAKEVCNIIKSAGGVLRVHPITVKEISMIIQKVETSVPHPFTSIASACERYKYNPKDFASMRLNLTKLAEEQGVSVFPVFSEKDIANVIRDFKGKRVTKLLGEARTKKPESYSQDNFREIHDIFMHEYIKDRQKKQGEQRILFITNNLDLIDFCREMNKDFKTMISTNRVILELWMHNTRPTDISNCALTSTMAICLEQHSTRIRSMVAEVSRFYNHTKEGFDLEVYKDFIQKLYKRAKNVITMVGSDPESISTFGSSFSSMIAEAVKADNLHYNKTITETQQENKKLVDTVVDKEHEIARLQGENSSHQAKIDNLQNTLEEVRKEKERIEKKRKEEQEERQRLEKEKQAEKEAKEKAEKMNRLYQERNEKKQRLYSLENDIKTKKSEAAKHFCNWQPWLLWIIAFLIIAVVLIIWWSVNQDVVDNKWNMLWFLCIAVPFISGAIQTTMNASERREKYVEKLCNSDECFRDLVKEKDQTERRLADIDEELKMLG